MPKRNSYSLEKYLYFFAAYALLTLTISDAKMTLAAISESNCSKKESGTSKGKICFFNNNTHYLKQLDQSDISINDITPDPIAQYFNFALLRAANITTPNAQLISLKPKTTPLQEEKDIKNLSRHDQSDVYFASEEIANFIPAIQILEKIYGSKKPTPLEIRNNLGKRAAFINYIGGETGLAKLAVTGTLVSDVVNNYQNWGIDDNTNLVVIDADLSPENLPMYFASARMMPHHINFIFTIKTLKEMLKLYHELLIESPVPYSLSTPDFIFFIRTLKKAIQSVINEFETKKFYVPFMINQRLSQKITACYKALAGEGDTDIRAACFWSPESTPTLNNDVNCSKIQSADDLQHLNTLQSAF